VPAYGTAANCFDPPGALVADIRIGCSGWNYSAWAGRFYPAELGHADWLRYYATVFDTVEINNSFYRLPARETFSGWRRQTPGEFVFAVKASRYLTHLKRLRDPEEPVTRLFDRARGLGVKLGPLLYQLPPQQAVDFPRLDRFLAALPRTRLRGLPVIEFRHASWYVPETFRRLEARGVSICLHDHRDGRYDGPWTGPLLYVRFHGTSGKYAGRYDDHALAPWAGRLAAHASSGGDAYAYFNNDPDAAAPENALMLKALLGHASARPSGRHAEMTASHSHSRNP
jgi:uncharacterized protein YecE (DUF72 family)